MSKWKKGSFLYYICESIAEEELAPLTLKKLKFLTTLPDADGNYQVTGSLKHPEILSYAKLSHLIDAFLNGGEAPEKEEKEKGFDQDDFVSKIRKHRIDDLTEHHTILRLDVETKILTLVKKSDLLQCIHAHFLKKNAQTDADAAAEPRNDAKEVPVPHDYFKIFCEQLSKCFGQHEDGILEFSTMHMGNRTWDVKRVGEGKFHFGITFAQNVLFPLKLRTFFQDQSGCILRIFTDQMHEGLPFKELYGFFLNKDFKMHNIDYLTLERACNTDAQTGKELPPEKNVIYCDLDIHKLPSFDLE